MSITLPRTIIQAAVAAQDAAFRSLTDEQQGLLFTIAKGHSMSGDVQLPTTSSNELLTALIPWAEQSEKKSYAKALKAIVSPAAGAGASTIPNLLALPTMIERFLLEGVIDGWIYELNTDGRYYPTLVTRIEYNPPDERMKVPARVQLHHAYITADGFFSECESFDFGAIRGKTVEALLASVGMLHETEALKADYLKSLEKFHALCPCIGQEYRATGIAHSAKQHYRRDRVDYSKVAGGGKLVNDHRAQGFHDVGIDISRRPPSEVLGGIKWLDKLKPDGAPVPKHPLLLCFDLNSHQHVKVNTDYLEVYQYDAGLKNHLVLPEAHRDLIEALLEQTDADTDVVAGKNAGTVILAKGPPGVGKTLTAEVYAESCKMPLYRVHSGQLGVDAEDVEAALRRSCERAKAWGAALLLDEADVYVRARGEDVQQCALVAAFLRVIEYVNIPLFMTSNREDIDDAILSRCIAIVRYSLPDNDARSKLWRLFGSKNGTELMDAEIEALVGMFPTASGRDIKQLFSLASRYAAKRSVRITPDVIRYVAQFRGF